MQLTVLEPNKILTITDFLSPAECVEFIQQSEKIGYEDAKLDIGKVIPFVRNNLRVLHKDEVLAQKLWERLAPFMPQTDELTKAIGLNELFRFYKYHKGHRFKGHQDGSYIRSKSEFSRFTFMIYLNEACEGGETKFLNHSIKPETGMALIFLHKLYHEGSEVRNGTKYVLRSDVMFRRTKAYYKQEGKGSDL